MRWVARSRSSAASRSAAATSVADSASACCCSCAAAVAPFGLDPLAGCRHDVAYPFGVPCPDREGVVSGLLADCPRTHARSRRAGRTAAPTRPPGLRRGQPGHRQRSPRPAHRPGESGRADHVLAASAPSCKSSLLPRERHGIGHRDRSARMRGSSVITRRRSRSAGPPPRTRAHRPPRPARRRRGARPRSAAARSSHR